MSVWDSDDLGSIAQKVSWALFAVASFTCALRVYCRFRYSPGFGGGLYTDDFVTLFCLGVLFLFCVLISAALPSGIGRHFDTLSPADQVRSLRWNAVLNAVTPWICTLPKFAIITTLRRILNYGTKTTLVFWGLALSSQATVVAMMAWGLAQCRPVAYQWDQSIEGGVCADPHIYVDLAYVTYVYSTVLDVFFALYPVPFVMRLNMPLKVRVGVALSLSISWLGFAISVYKFSIFPKLGALLATDPSYPLVYLSMTHAVEGSFLIISTSFATLRPLVRGVKQQVASLPMVSRLATRRHSTGVARSGLGGGGVGGGGVGGGGGGGVRSMQSHVDVMDYVLHARKLEGLSHELRSSGSCGALIECCNCCQRDDDEEQAGGGLEGRARARTCVDCGREVGSGRDTARRSTVSGVTWMEMIKS